MNDRPRILATAQIPPIAWELFGSIGDVSVAGDDEPDSLAGSNVLIVRSTPVDTELLDRAPQLRVVARTGVGLDKIDLRAASERGIPVVYAPDAGTLPVAEGTLALILAASKRLGELGGVVSEGRWDERYDYEVRDLGGARLGIVGLGRIGSEVARLGAAIGMEVIYHEPREPEPETAFGGRSVGLRQLFAEADVISLHCSLTEATLGMVDRELLSTVKPGTILVNASRGGLIAGDSLLAEALDRGWLGAVGLDVFGQEPPSADEPLLGDPRVICTPHSIGLSRSWNERVFGSLAHDVRAVLDGRPPRNIANPEALDRSNGSPG